MSENKPTLFVYSYSSKLSIRYDDRELTMIDLKPFDENDYRHENIDFINKLTSTNFNMNNILNGLKIMFPECEISYFDVLEDKLDDYQLNDHFYWYLNINIGHGPLFCRIDLKTANGDSDYFMITMNNKTLNEFINKIPTNVKTFTPALEYLKTQILHVTWSFTDDYNLISGCRCDLTNDDKNKLLDFLIANEDKLC